MKIVVIGGTGLIGSMLVATLDEHDQNAVAASPASGVNTLTGEGLAEILVGASVLVAPLAPSPGVGHSSRTRPLAGIGPPRPNPAELWATL